MSERNRETFSTSAAITHLTYLTHCHILCIFEKIKTKPVQLYGLRFIWSALLIHYIQQLLILRFR